MKIEWKFKKDTEPQGSSDGFYYDIVYGGYIKPEELLDDEKQIVIFSEALEIVHSFEEALQDNELLNEF
jgi:hypothetical protein